MLALLACAFLHACTDKNAVACATCQLSATTVAVLRVDTGDVVLGESSAAVQFGAGFVALSSDRERILQFSATGELLRVAGQSGHGPGELHHAEMLVPLDANTLLVSQNGRYLVFDSTLVWHRTLIAPGRYCMYGLPDRAVLCVAATDSVGAFARLDSLGVEESRFGPRGRLCPTCQGYFLSDVRPDAGGVAIAALRHRIIEHWNLAGHRTARLPYVLPDEAFPAGEPGETTTDNLAFPLSTRTYGGWRDTEGNHFLVLSRPAKGAPVTQRSGTRRPGSFTLNDLASFSSIVALIDARGDFRGYLTFEHERVIPAGPSLISRARYDDNAMVELVVEEITVPQRR